MDAHVPQCPKMGWIKDESACKRLKTACLKQAVFNWIQVFYLSHSHENCNVSFLGRLLSGSAFAARFL